MTFRVVLVAALVVLAGCGEREGRVVASVAPDLAVSFEVNADGVEAVNEGTSSVTVGAKVGKGGAIVAAVAPDGSGALTFPAFKDPDPPLALVTMSVNAREDLLSPGSSDFEFGLDFSADEVTEGGVDNGNNLMQRGLFADGAQYKLQLDHGLVSCRVRGAAGELLVTSETPVEPESWHRLRCRLRGDELTLRIYPLNKTGETGAAAAVSKSGSVGAVTFPRTLPISLGGKLSPEGEVTPSSPDQFNGELGNVVFDRLG